jgi:carboxyl-terminal processing protease
MPNSSPLKNIALIMLGLFVGALLFVLGMSSGVMLTRPGAPLAHVADSLINRNAADDEAAAASDSSAASGRIDQALVDDVLRRLRTQWYGEMPSNATLTDGAVRGMVNALGDPFTQYVEPKLARIMEQDISGKFEGIGASLRSTKSGAVQIVRVFKGSPAEKAGVRADDIIEAVDGRLVTGMGTTEVAAIVRGPKGTDVRLTLRRADRPRSFDIVVTRDEIVIPLVTSKVVGKNSDIAYVSLFDFSATAGGQLEEEIQALLDRKPRALVLDLRDNPGGLLSQAAAVGDIFLKKGAFVIERDFKGAKKTTETTDRGIAQDVPLYVLVNGGSASAAEIVAGAIQDTGRGKLFGVTTFGKGSVQSPQTLSNGGQLRITIERWYTPNDRAIHGVGITPDLIVDDVPDDDASADEQLDAVVNFLDTGKLPTSIATPTATP